MKSDIEIAQQTKLQNIQTVAQKLGLDDKALGLYGNNKAKISWPSIRQLKENKHMGKLILLTSINPTPAGEGKSTIVVGLADALQNQLHQKVAIALREPSLGPVMGLKGGATGGGYAQVVPMEDINLHFTGDMHALTSAIDTLAALIDNHLQQGNALRIDPKRILFQRGLDINDRSLRHLTIGQGKPTDGVTRETEFQITVASELMAILCLANDLDDLKRRLGNILIGYTYDRQPIFVRDLKVEGAIATLLKDALKPNLVQSLEHTPAFVHGGPFANIAHGTNSVLATELALHTADYVVTEAGFGADLGGQKYLDFVSKHLPKAPDVIGIVATVRALKYQSLGKTDQLDQENLSALTAGFKNLQRHIENMLKYKLPVIVIINRFSSDTTNELELLQSLVQKMGVRVDVVNYHDEGSQGGVSLAKQVTELAKEPSELHSLYSDQDDVQTKIYQIATEIYRAEDVEYSHEANLALRRIKKLGLDRAPVIIAKTQYSFSDNAKKLGAPEDFILHVNNLEPKTGAGFVVVYTGSVLTMPGLPKHPAALDIDVDNNGRVSGLF